jgi:hypothetical protein
VFLAEVDDKKPMRSPARRYYWINTSRSTHNVGDFQHVAPLRSRSRPADPPAVSMRRKVTGLAATEAHRPPGRATPGRHDKDRGSARNELIRQLASQRPLAVAPGRGAGAPMPTGGRTDK